MKTTPLIAMAVWFALSGCTTEPCNNDLAAILKPTQTSAGLLMEFAKLPVCQDDVAANPAKPSVEDKQRAVMVYDLYIKAHSYAILNKSFFWLSIASAIAVFLWPALGVLLKDRLGDREWYRSAIVQTTITGIAALMFALYSQYKDKQTYTENLMRYAVFSNKPTDELLQKIVEEMGKIDNGFSFGSAIDKQAAGSTPTNQAEP